MTMTQEELGNWINELIEKDNLHVFYTSTVWLKVRAEVLKEDKNECQHCKARGFYTKANHVHHVNYVKKRPELALSKWYVDWEGNMGRNLISLCRNCHERIHDYRRTKKKKFLTEERW